MRPMFWLPAVLTLLAANPGHAQGDAVVGPFAPAVQPTVQPSGPRFLTPGFPGASAGFDFGFDPRVQQFPFGGPFVDPSFWWSPAFTYVPAYGPLYSGPLVNNLGTWQARNWAPTFGYGFSAVPIAGVNSPPIGRQIRLSAPVREYRRTLPRTGAGERTGAADVLVPAAEIDPQQVRLAAGLENAMENRPLVEGEVERVGATGVVVRYRDGQDLVSERFPHGQVYFFQGERLASGATNPEVLEPGKAVLVPTPEPARQSVAGTREETPEARPVAPPPPTRSPANGRSRGTRRPAR